MLKILYVARRIHHTLQEKQSIVGITPDSSVACRASWAVRPDSWGDGRASWVRALRLRLLPWGDGRASWAVRPDSWGTAAPLGCGLSVCGCCLGGTAAPLGRFVRILGGTAAPLGVRALRLRLLPLGDGRASWAGSSGFLGGRPRLLGAGSPSAVAALGGRPRLLGAGSAGVSAAAFLARLRPRIDASTKSLILPQLRLYGFDLSLCSCRAFAHTM